MSGSASSQGRTVTHDNSLLALIRLLGRLVPKQLSDEMSLAKNELKNKGIKVGIAAAFLVVALVFFCFFVVALIGAAILALSIVLPGWLAALLIAALFLLILLIAALIGVSRIKKAMPLLPEAALYGVRYDIGVLREGRAFDPKTLEKTPGQLEAEKKAKQDKAAEAKREKAANPPLNSDDLKTRSGQRRAHLAGLRDELGYKLDIPQQRKNFVERTKASIADFQRGLRYRFSGRASGVSVEASSPVSARWKAISVFAVSSGAVIVFMRKLFRA